MWHFFLYYNHIVQSQCDRLILPTGEGFREAGVFFCTPVAIFVDFLQLSFACMLCHHEVSFWISKFFFSSTCRENEKNEELLDEYKALLTETCKIRSICCCL
jgi:hypothetical protein